MDEKKILDLIILGAGPAGMAAAIYAARAELSFVILEKEPMSGGQIINTYEVDNYPGLKGSNGFDLAVTFKEHCESLGVTFKNGKVTELSVEGDVKSVVLSDGTVLYAKTLIVATGAAHRMLGAKGEKELAGCGVSYCATCDGAFFRNRETAVIGGGDVAIEDALFLARICKKVTLIHRRQEFRAAKTLVSRLEQCENVEFVLDSTVEEICGNGMVEGIRVKNKLTGEEREIPVQGIFVAVGMEPNTALLENKVELEYGYVKAGEDCKTSIPGVFAAGDVRTKPLRQIVTAAADGAVAVQSAEQYLLMK